MENEDGFAVQTRATGISDKGCRAIARQFGASFERLNDGTLVWIVGGPVPPPEPEPAVEPEISDAEWLAQLHAYADREGETKSQVYFIGATEGLIKIGHSTNPTARLSGFQIGSPVDLSILALAPGGVVRETAYHFQFAEHRIRGEWFQPHPDILAEIERLSAGAQ